MTFAAVARDAWVAGVMASLLCVALSVVLAAWVSALTVVRARRRARRAAGEPDALRLWYRDGDLAQIEEAFARILVEERGAPPQAHRL